MGKSKKIAIIGTVGLPAKYGGFETLADNIVLYAETNFSNEYEITVYCSAPYYDTKIDEYHGARIVYSNFRANGVQSIIYDMISCIHAIQSGNKKLLVLGVSGSIIFPFIRLFSSVEIITNVDGIEWRRSKWKSFSKYFLKFSEKIAVFYSTKLIADNKGISDHIINTYGKSPSVIAYGGDNALRVSKKQNKIKIPIEIYALALCRIEPENNVEMILNAFERVSLPLVFIGNWNKNEFGERMRRRYGAVNNI
jgi:glycosyltransferase involved in cell wall biosynthesis